MCIEPTGLERLCGKVSRSIPAGFAILCLLGRLAVTEEPGAQSPDRTGGALAAKAPSRQSVSLDGPWAFALDPKNVGEKENWWGPEKALPDKIQVPGCWQAQGFGQPQGCLRHQYEGPAWYKKSVPIPANWKGKTLWLKIGGASRRTTAYVNGKKVGFHDGYLTPFRFDISDAVTPGRENVIAIRVDNSGGGPIGCFNLDQFRQLKQATPESMRKINAPTVLLLDAEMLDRCIWTHQGKVFRILVSHYGSRPIQEGNLSWRLMLGDKTLIQGNQPGITADVGDVKEIATANLGILSLEKGERLELVVELKEPHGTYTNSWPIWAFPRTAGQGPKATIACQRQLAGALAAYDFIKPFGPAKKPDVLIASQLDPDTQQYVREGGKLVLFPRRIPWSANIP